MLRATIVVCLAFISVCTSANALDVMMRIRLNKATYKIGERIKLHITYENTSRRTIRFLPEPERYHADILAFSEENRKKAGKVIPFGEMSVDFEAMSKRTVLLRPGRSCARDFDLQVASSLPPSYGDNTKGLFLWFAGSNIQLPHLGRYYITGKYYCLPNHPVRPYVTGTPPLWYGRIESRPVLVQFE